MGRDATQAIPPGTRHTLHLHSDLQSDVAAFVPANTLPVIEAVATCQADT